jgi:hypothetical protein
MKRLPCRQERQCKGDVDCLPVTVLLARRYLISGAVENCFDVVDNLLSPGVTFLILRIIMRIPPTFEVDAVWTKTALTDVKPSLSRFNNGSCAVHPRSSAGVFVMCMGSLAFIQHVHTATPTTEY